MATIEASRSPACTIVHRENDRRVVECRLSDRGEQLVEEIAGVRLASATLARSQLAGIGAGIAIYFGEQFASIFLPDIVKYLPFNAANAVVATTGGGGFGGGGATLPRLEPDTAMLVVAVWLVGALVVTALFTERAEISG